MEFVCRDGLPDGRVIQDVRTAPDLSSLRVELEKQGMHLFEAKPKGVRAGLGLPRLGSSRRSVSNVRLLVFNQELASLLKAGLPLTQALDLMLERMEKGPLREIVTDVRDRVQTGQEISEAFAVHADALPSLFPASLKAGERSGELEKVLRRFVRYLKLVTDARKRVVSALIYPAVLLTLSFGMILVLSIAVVPRFREFFGTLGVELPLVTKIVVGFSSFLVDNLLVLSIAVVVGTVFFLRWRKTRLGRLTLDRWKIKIPLLGGVLHRFAVSEFSRSLGTLLAGGIPLVSAFETSAGAVGNQYVRARLVGTIQLVREGSAFYSALEKSDVMLPIAVDMVKVGEATGALDEMLTNVSDFLDEEVETLLQRILSLIEPVMLVFLAGIISVILVSIYLPLFSSLSQTAF